MFYMKAGRAGRWATREFEHEAKSGHLRFIDWVDFEDEFWKDFMPLDSEAAAVNVLETTLYFLTSTSSRTSLRTLATPTRK